MRGRGRRLAVLAALGAAAIVPGGASPGQAGVAGVRVIVQTSGTAALDAAGAPSARALGARVDAAHAAQDAALDRARDAGVDVRLRRRYGLLFQGFAAEVAPSDLQRLRTLPGIVAVRPDRTVTAGLDASVPLVRAPELWGRTDPAGVSVRGRGVRVAVVDTGIDYTHPALGAGFGAGHRVVGGWDFVNDDADPMDDNFHGTHVAGIVGASGAVVGVAPEVSLVAYKVLDQDGRGDESDVLAALERAADPANLDRADVVNMSLSGPGDGQDPMSQAVDQAVAAGVVVVTTSGNSGPGTGTVASPGAAASALTVGASASNVRVPSLALVAPTARPIASARKDFSANLTDRRELSLVDAGAGTPEELDAIDVNGRAVLVHDAFFAIVVGEELERRGARAALFYEPDFGPPTIFGAPGAAAPRLGTGEWKIESFDDGRLDTLAAVSISTADASQLKQLLEGGPVTVAIEARDATDTVADFSSRGPAPRFGLKPELVAPGVEIRSTVPMGLHPPGTYRFSGTSMAAPHVTGAAALLRQLHPGWDARTVTAALTQSAKRLDDADAITQGAGRLDVAAAADATVLAEPRVLSLGLADMAGAQAGRDVAVTFTNHGDGPASVALSTRPADGVPAADVSVTPASLDLPAGGSATATFSIRMARPQRPLDVSGWVEALVHDPGGSRTLRLPYDLSARPLVVHTVPDPTVTDSEALIYSEAPLGESPLVTVTGPDGAVSRVRATFDHAHWWRAPVKGGVPGIYRLDVSAPADTDGGPATLTGAGSFEVQRAPSGIHAPSRWQPAGPYSDGGRLALAPTSPGRLFVAPDDDPALFRTDDHGGSWRELDTLPVGGGSPVDVVVDPTDANHLYAAINGAFIDPTYQGRILESRDGGTRWAILPAPNVEMRALAIDGSGRTVVAVTAEGGLVSRDGGASWDALAGPWSRIGAGTLIGADLYLATDAGLYRIANATGEPGAAELLFETPHDEFGSPEVFGVAGDDRLLLANTYFHGLYASRDGGATWQLLFMPTTTFAVTGAQLQGDEVIVTAYDEIWAAGDLGRAPFVPRLNPAVGAVLADFAAWRPRGRLAQLLGAFGSGVYQTRDGQSYERVGVPGVDVYDLATTRDGEGHDVLVAGTTFDTYRTQLPQPDRGGELEWGASGAEATFGSAVRLVADVPGNPTSVWKVRQDAIGTFWVYRSKNGGRTWDVETRQTQVANALLVHPADPRRVYVSYWSLTGQGLVVTRDGGGTWSRISLGHLFTGLAGDPTNPDRLWLVGPEGLFVSEDGGDSVRLLHELPLSSVAVDPFDPQHLLLGGASLLSSEDGGQTLRETPYDGLPMQVSEILPSPRERGVVYAATSAWRDLDLPKAGRGVLRSTDGGRTWRSFSLALQDRDVNTLALSRDGVWLYAGTEGGAAHRIRLRR